DDKVFKKYQPAYLTERKREELLDKITKMAFHYKHFADLKEHPFAWPLGPVIETQKDLAALRGQGNKVSFDSSEFCGFVMPRVRDFYNLDDVITQTKLGYRPITGKDRLRILRRIAE